VDNLPTLISGISSQNLINFSAERSTRPAAVETDEARLRIPMTRELRYTTFPPFCLNCLMLALSCKEEEEVTEALGYFSSSAFPFTGFAIELVGPVDVLRK